MTWHGMKVQVSKFIEGNKCQFLTHCLQEAWDESLKGRWQAFVFSTKPRFSFSPESNLFLLADPSSHIIAGTLTPPDKTNGEPPHGGHHAPPHPMATLATQSPLSISTMASSMATPPSPLPTPSPPNSRHPADLSDHRPDHTHLNNGYVPQLSGCVRLNVEKAMLIERESARVQWTMRCRRWFGIKSWERFDAPCARIRLGELFYSLAVAKIWQFVEILRVWSLCMRKFFGSLLLVMKRRFAKLTGCLHLSNLENASRERPRCWHLVCCF